MRKSTNNKELLQQIDVFEEDMEFDYEDLVDLVKKDPTTFASIFKVFDF